MTEMIISLHEIGDGHENVWHAHGDSDVPSQNGVDMHVFPIANEPQIVLSKFMGESGTLEESGTEISIIFKNNDTFGNSVYEPIHTNK